MVSYSAFARRRRGEQVAVLHGMGGPQFVGLLGKKRSDFAVIFMSGYTEAAALETANIGSEAILLNKPFAPDVLAHKISEILQKPAGGISKGAAGSGAN